MARGKWITGDSIPEATICRVLTIPNEPIFRAAVTGALSELIYADNFQQVGAVTPAEMAAGMLGMYNAFLESECNVTNITIAIVAHEAAQGINGGTYTGPNITNTIPFNVVESGESWLSLAANIFTIDPGRYMIDMRHVTGLSSGFMWSWAENEVGFPVWTMKGNQLQPALDREVSLIAELNTSAAFNFGFRLRSNQNTVVNTGFGAAKNLAGFTERYGQVRIVRLGDF